MALQVKHHTQAVGIYPDDGELGPSQWNEAHDLTIATGTIVGRVDSDDGPATDLTPDQVRTLINVADGADATGAALAAGSVMQFGKNSGAGYLQFVQGSSTLPGYISFFTPDDIRRGFVGWAGATGYLTLAGDNGWSWHAEDFYVSTSLQIGHATDTTVTRSAPGRIAVEGVDVALLGVTDQVITGGARITPLDLGNLSGASITPDPGDRPTQKVTNNGAGSLLPGSNPGSYRLIIINAVGAGAMTTTGWTLKGDPYDTGATSKFLGSADVYTDMAVLTLMKVA